MTILIQAGLPALRDGAGLFEECYLPPTTDNVDAFRSKYVLATRCTSSLVTARTRSTSCR